ncbi:hypothetical protein P9112_010735 [Eukaryota sp. TZLM1-RC]
MLFKKGQSCLAKVELFPRNWSYILAQVVDDQVGDSVKVRDPQPEPDQRRRIFKVPRKDVYPWTPEQDVPAHEYSPGQTVLALVYLEDLGEWSTQAYRGEVKEIRPDGKPVLRILFEDDQSVEDIPFSFVVPEQQILQAEPVQDIFTEEQSIQEEKKGEPMETSEEVTTAETKTESAAESTTTTEPKTESKPSEQPSEEQKQEGQPEEKEQVPTEGGQPMEPEAPSTAEATVAEKVEEQASPKQQAGISYGMM